MKFTYYASNKLQNTVTAEVKEIFMQTEPEYMTDDERERIHNGEHTPMLCYIREDGVCVSVPVEFAIKIEG